MVRRDSYNLGGSNTFAKIAKLYWGYQVNSMALVVILQI